jgi:hypothetical protein
MVGRLIVVLVATNFISFACLIIAERKDEKYQNMAF